MTTPLEARGLAVGWGRHPVLEGVHLTLDAGRTLALVGTNGSGKSTLLRTLAGLLAPMGGQLRVLGAAPGTQPRRVAYVGQFHPQGFVLPLRARDVVAMGRYPRRGLVGRLRADDQRLVDDAMERMDVGALAGRALRDLSGGQQQRVYLAQMLAWHADVLLLDEPAAGLDVRANDLLARALDGERARGAAVVVATHDIRDAMAADVAVMLAGRVVAAGAPAAVVNRDTLRDTFGLVVTDALPGVALAVDPHAHHDHPHSH